MARIPRIEVVDCPHHVTQRGNRRLQTFYSDADYLEYLRLLVEAKEKAGVAVWAYCFMPNHVHLVVVPTEKGGLARLMQHPNRRYAWRINKRMNWQGHLWQSRFYSCPMDERHLIAAVQYVELNPVRARLCEDPRDWRWSSIHAHLKGKNDPLVDAGPMLERAPDWDDFLARPVSGSVIESIRSNSSSGRPAGNDGFVSLVETRTGTRLRKRRPGRSRKQLGN